MVTRERWKRIARPYEQVLEQEPSARAAFIANACGDDTALRTEIESLLCQEDVAGLIDRPLWGAAWDLIEHYNFFAWSPTADRIAFTADVDSDYEIFSVRSDGSGLARLTHSPGNNAHMTWSPDGKWIALMSARQGFKDESLLHPGNPQPYGEISVMRADGSDVRVLTDSPFEGRTPAWKPLRAKP